MIHNVSNLPAFPGRNNGSHFTGMTLLDYMAAHAPSEPQPWFKPEIGPQPGPAPRSDDPIWGLNQIGQDRISSWISDPCYDFKSDDPCYLCSVAIESWREKVAEWSEQLQMATLVQWPYAWARRVLESRP